MADRQNPPPMTCHAVRSPAIPSPDSVPSTTMYPNCTAMSSLRWSNLSASAPPNSVSDVDGMNCTMPFTPSSTADPDSW